MNIIGLDFFNDLSPVASLNDVGSGFDSIRIQNAEFDDLLVSRSVTPYGTIKIPTDWDNATVLHAQFNGDLGAGNVNYQAKIIDKMRVKRRKVGETKWISLYEHPIRKADDFQFAFVDRFAKVGEYEYCIVPIINGTEQNYISKKITSYFDGIILCDKEQSYKTIADESISSVTRNRPNNIVTTLENKYPYVVYNGSTNYESGSASGLFVEIDWNERKMKLDEIPVYSQKVMNFMMNGRPKILKAFDGRMWMVDITGSPSASVGNHPNQISISFEFTEIGHAESSSDLCNNSFIDVNVERS